MIIKCINISFGNDHSKRRIIIVLLIIFIEKNWKFKSHFDKKSQSILLKKKEKRLIKESKEI